jgi:hypothetical protein
MYNGLLFKQVVIYFPSYTLQPQFSSLFSKYLPDPVNSQRVAHLLRRRIAHSRIKFKLNALHHAENHP